MPKDSRDDVCNGFLSGTITIVFAFCSQPKPSEGLAFQVRTAVEKAASGASLQEPAVVLATAFADRFGTLLLCLREVVVFGICSCLSYFC